MDLSRRTALEAGLGALTTVALAGCIDDSTADDSSTTDRASNGDAEGDTDPEGDRDHSDDYPDDFDEPDGTETGATDENGYETYAVGGHEVPMAPTADVYDWYTGDRELVVADARSERAYERGHIEGAVSSPAPDGLETDDPLEDVPTDTRLVTYCTCPRRLSGHRAATLMDEGYTDAYLLKDGLQDWVEQGYPVAGTAVD